MLTASMGNLKYDDITKAIYKVLSEGKCISNPKMKEVFVHDVRKEDKGYEEQDDTLDEVFEAVAEIMQEEDGNYEDGLEIFETYSEIRKKMQSQKMTRGFKQFPQAPLHLIGTMQAKVQQLKDRTRCHICMKLEHWKRECPRKERAWIQGRKGSGKKSEMSQKAASSQRSEGHETMVADYELKNDYGYCRVGPEALELSERFNEVFFTEENLHELEAMISKTNSFV